MKKFLSILVLSMMLVTAPAKAMFPPDAKSQALIKIANVDDPLPGIGTIINQHKNMIKCVWNFAVLGGAVGSIGLLDDQGNACVLPTGALAVRNYFYTVTGVLPANGSNLAFGVMVYNDLKTNTADTVFTGAIEGAMTGSATLAVGPTTSASNQVFMYNAYVRTAGLIDLFIEYVYK